MMITATLISLVSLTNAPSTAPPAVELDWSAPEVFLAGSAFRVRVVATAGEGGGELEEWKLSPAAWTVNGKALKDRAGSGTIPLYASERMVVEFDLAPYFGAGGAFGPNLEVGSEFELGYAPVAGAAKKVQSFEAAPQDLNFMEIPAEELGDWQVVMRTNRGMMVMEFWPEVAPNHVRNFLDLAHTGFYDDILFHRIMPGFMIQGGDPLTKDPSQEGRWGTGSGPRQLEAEFNDRKHERGVLSMARTTDPNSATSQFFVCHARAPHLDKQYTAFGKLVSGYETLDAIATAPQTNTRPNEPQRIERAFVVPKPR